MKEPIESFERYGVLLLSDARRPSLAGLVAGEPIRGSWWGHPKSHAIFRTSCVLADHPDTVITKLVDGKVTFIHRRLWPALYTVATARESWQTSGLSIEARKLMHAITEQGRLVTGKAALELETRLLVWSEEVHTESGAHKKRLDTWERWARRVKLQGKKPALAEAKRQLETALAAVGARPPWP